MTAHPALRIGIDARKLFDGGIGTYIQGLLAGLAARPDAPGLVALVDPADRGRIEWPRRAVEEIPVQAGKYGLAEHFVVAQAAARAKVSLLHAPHYTLPLLWMGPSVVTIHDLIHVRFPRFFRPGAGLYARAVAGLAARRARRVLTVSAWTAREVVELLGIPQRKVRHIPIAPTAGLVPASAEEVRRYVQARGLPADYVLYVGARKPHKNLGLLLEAWALLPRDARPALVLSGSRWPDDEPLARRCAVLGLDPWVHFAGHPADAAELARLYGGARLYVQPSLAEGFGLPPLEAMACGVPVLASRETALPETLGDAAVYLPADQPAAWAAAIGRLLRDAGERQRRTAAGRLHAAGFTWQRTAEQTLAAYLEALG